MQDRPPGRLLALLSGLLLLASPSLAQVTSPFGDLPLDAQALRQAQQQAAQRAVPAVLSLEGALEPDLYVVGPGDRFTVTVGGEWSQEHHTTISADGYLLIAEVGRFKVAGLTLAEADRLVRPALQRIYRNVPAELALTQPRQFYVHVAGAVSAPGRHLVGPIARAEDAVRAAMDGENPLSVLRQIERGNQIGGEQRMYPALRNVRVLHVDGTSTSLDLRLYYSTGDREQNPYLRDGDVLFVPAFEPYQNAVFVEGSVLAAGIFDFRPGDTIQSLLTVATGTEAHETLVSVRLVRVDGTSEAVDLSRASTTQPLRPGDRLIVHPPSPDLGTVTIEGRVLVPGTYPVRAGNTTVGDLIAMAGGLREDALASASYLERRGATRPSLSGEAEEGMWPVGGGTAPSQAELQVMIQDEAFRALRLADLDFASRQYLLNELRRTPRAPLDVRGNPHSADLSVMLRDGDRLVIPEDPGGIYVFGQVARSGFVPFEPGLSAEAYIERAGHRTAGATDVYVRRAGSGYVTPAGEAGAVEPGDAVFVNRRTAADSETAHQLALQERQLRAQHTQQWIQIGTAMLGTATAIITALIFSR